MSALDEYSYLRDERLSWPNRIGWFLMDERPLLGLVLWAVCMGLLLTLFVAAVGA